MAGCLAATRYHLLAVSKECLWSVIQLYGNPDPVLDRSRTPPPLLYIGIPPTKLHLGPVLLYKRRCGVRDYNTSILCTGLAGQCSLNNFNGNAYVGSVPARFSTFGGPGTVPSLFSGAPERRSGAFRLTLTTDCLINVNRIGKVHIPQIH